jgi:hypothetical protein
MHNLLDEDLTSSGVHLREVVSRIDTHRVIRIVAGPKQGPEGEVKVFRIIMP